MKHWGQSERQPELSHLVSSSGPAEKKEISKFYFGFYFRKKNVRISSITSLQANKTVLVWYGKQFYLVWSMAQITKNCTIYITTISFPCVHVWSF